MLLFAGPDGHTRNQFLPMSSASGSGASEGPVAALQALRSARTAKQADRSARSARMKQFHTDRSSTPTVDEPPRTEAQQAAEHELTAKLQVARRSRVREPPQRFTPGRPGSSKAAIEYEEATGCRLVDLDLFNEHITRLNPDPHCDPLGLLTPPTPLWWRKLELTPLTPPGKEHKACGKSV